MLADSFSLSMDGETDGNVSIDWIDVGMMSMLGPRSHCRTVDADAVEPRSVPLDMSSTVVPPTCQSDTED